jgi:chemotaxis protein methyltransferase CheR
VVADVSRELDALVRPAGPPLDGVVAVLQAAHGFDVSCYGAAFLAQSLRRRQEGSPGCSDADYLERLAADPAEAGALVGSLRVGYSEFFRDPLAFALLERPILPALAEQRARDGGGEIRVWSAGCAAGQEAWSVAILLEELSAAQGRAVPYRVFATDVAEPDLDAARAGVYGAEAVGNVRARHVRAYFSRQGESYAVVPALRERVDFSVHDLLEQCTNCPPASIYGDFDLVLCCNVMLYYRPEMQRFILDKVRGSLAPGGYLVTGETERQIVEGAGGFRALAPPPAVFRATTRRS